MFCSQGLRNDIPGLWFISIDLFFRPSVLVHVPIGSNFIGNNLTMLWQQRKMENKCYTNCFFFLTLVVYFQVCLTNVFCLLTFVLCGGGSNILWFVCFNQEKMSKYSCKCFLNAMGQYHIFQSSQRKLENR